MLRAKRTILLALAALVGAFMVANSGPPQRAVGQAGREGPTIPRTNSVGSFPTRFPDYNLNYAPPAAAFDKPLFRLSQDYPSTAPPIDPKVEAIMKIPFRNNDKGESARKFLLAVRDYCFEGNLEVDWEGQDNPVRKWYHVPWQHWGALGREAIHGLTQEATAQPLQLGPLQTTPYLTYAVGLYNDQGGYTIGRVWRDHYNPDLTAGRFPVGTVVAKILFTQAPPEVAPYLVNPVEWQAFAQTSPTDTARKVQPVRLLQMDVMVRVPDELGTPTGWVFGNYCYNGATNHANRWENLVPNGLQWGDDPTVTSDPRTFNNKLNPPQPFPPKTTINPDLKETVILDSPDLPPQHEGWGCRLVGPVDYYNSSCLSCHATAQYPVYAPLSPAFAPEPIKIGSTEWMQWFRNMPCGDVFGVHPPQSSPPAQKAHPMDYSLQLANGLSNFEQWLELNGNPQPAPANPKVEAFAVARARGTRFQVRRDASPIAPGQR